MTIKARTFKIASRQSVIIALCGAALFSFLLLAGSGCSESDTTNDSPQVADKASCPATMDDSAWLAFRELADQLMAGQPATEEQMQTYGSLPVIVKYRESMVGATVSSTKLGNWIEAGFWEECSQGRRAKKSGDRRTYGRAFRFNYDHRQAVEEGLAEYENGNHPCLTYNLATKWLSPEKLPSPFVVNFVPGKPELRSHYGTIMVDPILLLAGGADQLDRQIVSTLYREREALNGPSPTEVEGKASVAQIYRIMMNEGVAAYIDQLPQTHFNDLHPKLSEVAIIPEDIFQTGIRAMSIFNTNLPEMLTDADAMEKRGNALGRSILGAGAYTNGGYCMAAVIAAHLGEEKLLEVRLSPPLFIQAYQEAAAKNPLPLPIPGKAGTALYETMPAFSDEVFAGLMEILEEAYPGSN